MCGAVRAEQEVSALNAAAFAHSLFYLLRSPGITFTEAFAMANHILRAHGCAHTGAKRSPVHPVLTSNEAPELPGTKPQPVPHVEGLDMSYGFSRSVPGACNNGLRHFFPHMDWDQFQAQR